MRAFLQGRRIVFVAAAVLLLSGCCYPAMADESVPSAEQEARDLADEVLRGAGNGDLGEWTRSVIDRALKRAGETARQSVPGSGSGAGPESPGQSASPLAAERHAGAIAGPRPPSAEVLVFTSLSVPAVAWRQWAAEAAGAGAPLVLRGVAHAGMRATAKAVGKRIGPAKVGIAIDPRLFRLFGVERVPAVAVVPGGVPPCESRGCSEDPAPPHDLVTGNIGLVAALEAVAAEGDAGKRVARTLLERLRGDDR